MKTITNQNTINFKNCKHIILVAACHIRLKMHVELYQNFDIKAGYLENI